VASVEEAEEVEEEVSVETQWIKLKNQEVLLQVLKPQKLHSMTMMNE
jgi:hypothetical protein